jgi:8-oxo-dGTP pyrophosphatase MutT (NUDIX family)
MPTPESARAAGAELQPADLADSPRTYVGAYALCVRDARVLLARIVPGGVDAGLWTLPGGGLHWGEEPAAGALRELEEETGLAGTITGIAGVYSATYLRSPERPRDSVHHLGIVYIVEAHVGELRPEVHGSTDCCAWVPLADLHALPLVALASFAVRLIRS